eukprot:GFUD01026235.1.p1 GENE.GFUD01026235.1~~GFUD01026235.1.p1  ORF type:complete len:1076 (+),score=430.02 GFUD01026235.1:59-3286(+)
MHPPSPTTTGKKFSQAGSIVRLKFTNFMQYKDTEFSCGPNLNVIIGPNGSGKSTIVNGICLGLAGKTSVLGRASSIAEFIKVGEDSAAVEVELFQPDKENVVICRMWDQGGKTNWTVDGKKAGLREVERLVAKFRIQVDNLCQFLPQDKVHDFSRLNSKGLLDSTVDAVGEVELKEKHKELKELQKGMNEGGELFERKRQMLVEKTEQCRRLEEDVKAFDEKAKIEKKITQLEGRMVWSKYQEVRRITKETKERSNQAKKRWEEQEVKMNPLKAALNEAKKKKAGLESKLQTFNGSIKDCMGKAKTHSQNIEKLEEGVEAVEEELEEIDRREEEKKAEMRRIQTLIAEMEAEYNSTEDDTSLGPQLAEARQAAMVTQAQLGEVKTERENLRYEQGNLVRLVKERQAEVVELNNVDRQKLDVLRSKSKETYEAVNWLRSNRDMFKGEVYEPFIVCGNVMDPAQAKYLENCINIRDLTAFFFQDAEDMNTFLNCVRNQKGLKKVSAVKVPDMESKEYQPNIPSTSLAQYGFISYLREMVTAPDSVLAYMCHNHKLHRIPVFKAEAEKFNDKLINEFGLTKFFIGVKLQTVSGSMYSSAKTTMTKEVVGNNTLQVSKDSTRERQVKEEIAEKEREQEQLSIRARSVDDKLRTLNVELESARKLHKDLEQKKNFRARHSAKIEAQRKLLRQQMAESSMEREKEEKVANRKGMVVRMVKSAQQLQAAIAEANKVRMAMELCRLAAQPLEEIIEEKVKAYEAAVESVKEMKVEMENMARELEEGMQALGAALREAKAATGVGQKRDEPPTEVVQVWEKEKFPSRVEDIEVMITELQAQAECMDTVDPRIVADYNKLKETIIELQQDIDRREAIMADSVNKMQEVKEAWLTSLSSLVERINTKFSAHFASMGFAGEVGLSTGQHEDDFENYGVKIRVKYRDSEPLQELTAHHQSGGERSVATALYMLALQELTTVPFRCVDEINQGMDAKNERRVFELLVRTSCSETSAQYFLLTPKLLPGLNYSPRMNILIVNNGPHMCHHTDWNMEAFHDRAAAAEEGARESSGTLGGHLGMVMSGGNCL